MYSLRIKLDLFIHTPYISIHIDFIFQCNVSPFSGFSRLYALYIVSNKFHIEMNAVVLCGTYSPNAFIISVFRLKKHYFQ